MKKINGINLRATINGRPVYVLNHQDDRWLDYYPTGCAFRTIQRDGTIVYVAKDNPNARITAPRVVD